MTVTVGVLALQGAFFEHLKLLRRAVERFQETKDDDVSAVNWKFIEVRTPEELESCDALIIPGGESTTMSLVAARSNLLEPLRDFVKVHRNPTWGTCAGLILLSESANKTKKGGQELIGGLDVKVNRNHFGRQTESFITDIKLPFLSEKADEQTFSAVFIRAPVVAGILPHKDGVQTEEREKEDTVVAPSRQAATEGARRAMSDHVEVLSTLKTRAGAANAESSEDHAGDIVAVRQGNVFGTSFHPELTEDARIHMWWLKEVLAAIKARS